jgi:hypothetical protein
MGMLLIRLPSPILVSRIYPLLFRSIAQDFYHYDACDAATSAFDFAISFRGSPCGSRGGGTAAIRGATTGSR